MIIMALRFVRRYEPDSFHLEFTEQVDLNHVVEQIQGAYHRSGFKSELESWDVTNEVDFVETSESIVLALGPSRSKPLFLVRGSVGLARSMYDIVPINNKEDGRFPITAKKVCDSLDRVCFPG
jgi:hypothetical protein